MEQKKRSIELDKLNTSAERIKEEKIKKSEITDSAFQALIELTEQENRQEIDETRRYFSSQTDIKSRDKSAGPLAEYHQAIAYKHGICGFSQDNDQAFQHFLVAATADHAASLFNVAYYCYSGKVDGMSPNWNGAMAHWQLAANVNHVVAHYCLGCCYLYGKGTSKDEVEAEKHLKIAADDGYAKAQFELAAWNDSQGRDKIAFNYAKAAADQNNVDAVHLLATLYHFGDGVEENLYQAVKLYKRGVDLGNNLSLYNLGQLFFEGSDRLPPDYEIAVDYFQQAAAQGVMQAYYWLGKCHQTGKGGLNENLEEAFSCYQKAATDRFDKPLIDTFFRLGECYQRGYGVTIDLEQALYYYRIAAKKWHAGALEEIGFFYDQGMVVQKDENEAANWFRMAADAADTLSKWEVAHTLLYRVKGNYKKLAVTLLEEAASSKWACPNAQYTLAGCYLTGTLPENFSKAIYWLKKASAQGHALAHCALADLYPYIIERGALLSNFLLTFEEKSKQSFTQIIINHYEQAIVLGCGTAKGKLKSFLEKVSKQSGEFDQRMQNLKQQSENKPGQGSGMAHVRLNFFKRHSLSNGGDDKPVEEIVGIVQDYLKP